MRSFVIETELFVIQSVEIEIVNYDLYEVKFNYTMAAFCGYMEDGDYEMFGYVLGKKVIDVIGNIYQNKDLLSGK